MPSNFNSFFKSESITIPLSITKEYTLSNWNSKSSTKSFSAYLIFSSLILVFYSKALFETSNESLTISLNLSNA